MSFKTTSLALLDAAISSRSAAATQVSNASLTPTRAGFLDRLDDLVSSRAPGSTALTNGIWTNARAAYLDMLASGGIPGIVKSIQTGYLNAVGTGGSGEDVRYTDVSISAVGSMSKCVVSVTPGRIGVSGTDTTLTARLTSASSVRVSNSSGASQIGRWWVVEYF